MLYSVIPSYAAPRVVLTADQLKVGPVGLHSHCGGRPTYATPQHLHHTTTTQALTHHKALSRSINPHLSIPSSLPPSPLNGSSPTPPALPPFTPSHPLLHSLPPPSCSTMSRALLFAALSLLLSLVLSPVPHVSGLPTVTQGANILGAEGVALSADGSRAFVMATIPPMYPPETASYSAVYVLPLPFNSSAPTPAPYYTSPTLQNLQFIAASASTAPQVVWIMSAGVNFDSPFLLNRMYALNITSPAATNTSLIFNFGKLTFQDPIGGVSGMFYQPSTNLLFFACQMGVTNSAVDFIGFFDPTVPSPTLQKLYVSSMTAALSAVAVSSTRLYFAISQIGYTEIVYLPLNSPGSTSLIPSSTVPQVLSFRNFSVGANQTVGPAYPVAFVLSADESILYIDDFSDYGSH